MSRPLPDTELLQLQRWNTPTIYNGWEQITQHDPARDGFNLEEVRDFLPAAPPICGWAVTVVIQPGDRSHAARAGELWAAYRAHLASLPGPKIVVAQDLDKPACYGAGWGEVNANIHRALGVIGAIIDGAVRDVDELHQTGFKTLARRLSVGHACAVPIRWNCEVEVFGRKVVPGQLIHADKHGFLAIPSGEERDLLEAARFMDRNECDTLISAARSCHGLTPEQALARLDAAAAAFGRAARERFGRRGEW